MTAGGQRRFERARRRAGACMAAMLLAAALPSPAFAAWVPYHPGLFVQADGEAVSALATGAPQAAGRTAESVAALVSAARSATASAAESDLVSAATVPATVHVKQFGAKGDGVTDDAAALQAAFDCGATTILFEHGASYRVNAPLTVRKSNVTILGNGATIFTDASYAHASEFFFMVHGTMPNGDDREAVLADWETLIRAPLCATFRYTGSTCWPSRTARPTHPLRSSPTRARCSGIPSSSKCRWP